MQSLYGRRSRSHSRTGMRVLVDQIKASTPRPKSPHMNNEEPIKNSHYPDGRAREEGETAPIERPDFPAPPFAYAERRKKKKKKARRPWSEPGKRMPFCKDTDTEEDSQDDEDSPYESSSRLVFATLPTQLPLFGLTLVNLEPVSDQIFGCQKP